MSLNERMGFDKMCEAGGPEVQVTTASLDHALWRQRGACQVTTSSVDPDLWHAEEVGPSILADIRRDAASGEVR